MSVFYVNWTASGKQPQTHGRMIHARNVLTDGTIAGSAADTGYTREGPDGWETYERWKAVDDIAAWGLTWAGDRNANCACVAAHTIGSTGSSIRVDTYDGSTWTAIAAEESPADDSPIMIFFDTQTARGFRVRVEAGTDRPELGVIKFGRVLEMEHPVFAGVTPSRFARNTSYRSFRSETGETLGRTRQRTNLSGSLSFEHLSPEWVDDNWVDAQLALEEKPFFLAWRPDSTKTTSVYGDVIFGEATSTPRVPTMGVRDLMSTTLEWSGPAYE